MSVAGLIVAFTALPFLLVQPSRSSGRRDRRYTRKAKR